MSRLLKSIPRKKVVTGILVDVSGSMKKSMPGGGPNEPWASSIFQVVDSLVEHDVTAENKVFTIGFGARRPDEKEVVVIRQPVVYPVFDVIATIDLFKKRLEEKIRREVKDKLQPYRKRPHEQRVEEIISILEKNGAHYIRDWLKNMEIVERHLSTEDSVIVLYTLEIDPEFLRVVIYDCLPVECREGVVPKSSAIGPVASFFSWVATPVVAFFKPATDNHVWDVIQKAKLFYQPLFDPPDDPDIPDLVGVTDNSIFEVDKAYNILRGDGKDLTRCVAPCIYGFTPLLSALQDAERLFSTFTNHKKLLFVLSDGLPTDDIKNKKGLTEVEVEKIRARNREMAIYQIRSTDVTVVCCYVTQDKKIQPLRLYTTKQESWVDGAKFMFDLASTYPTQSLPRTIFTRRKSGRDTWKIDYATNETRLFVQVNHQKNIRDVCELARDVVCSGDALSDVLASVDLDLYINEYNTRFPAQKRQKGETCYAHASAVVMHLAMKSILGRDGGYPDFKKLRDEMVKEYGADGAETFVVLRKVCPKYRLQVRQVDMNGALQAVAEKRPVVARFTRTDAEIKQCVKFFESIDTRTGVFTKDHIWQRRPGGKCIGHAVVLTSYTSKYLCFMDSWGYDWGDNGFTKIGYKVFDEDMKFFDVFWELQNLMKKEKTYYKKHGADQAAEVWKSFKGLQRSTYTCPLASCRMESPVTDFTGNIGNVICPKCRKVFRGCDSGNILALNMYLTSISEDHKPSVEAQTNMSMVAVNAICDEPAMTPAPRSPPRRGHVPVERLYPCNPS